jgi:hypothetical protein
MGRCTDAFSSRPFLLFFSVPYTTSPHVRFISRACELTGLDFANETSVSSPVIFSMTFVTVDG